jgi:hypothetical protein
MTLEDLRPDNRRHCAALGAANPAGAAVTPANVYASTWAPPSPDRAPAGAAPAFTSSTGGSKAG